ncbi:Nucleic acid-binding, OB-fold containing protein [Parasponia andersonii]|uniref:Nucleic acid-binding, OB-fold containing protein n=1 Tax=Parasponia andersonii TaxID=3476 RepID=A0A2P5B3M9_PARAD|nr:Nucleic acid-binding, OB-fold containing protein [Parasponia andersonii]
MKGPSSNEQNQGARSRSVNNQGSEYEKKTKGNDNVADELKNLRERMNLVAATLEKPRKLNAEKIEKVDDLSLESKVVVYGTLAKDEKAAKAFLAITGELVEDEFGNDIFEA